MDALMSPPLSADAPLWAERLGGLGETSVTLDGRGPRSLTFFIRAGSSRLVSHAYALSEDGGETWSEATALPSLMGPTCEGSVVGVPRSRGKVLLSAPYSGDAGLNGREDLRLWVLDTSTTPPHTPTMVGRLWGCKAAYSAFSQERADGVDGAGGAGTNGTVLSLFEAGETFRYASIILARYSMPTTL